MQPESLSANAQPVSSGVITNALTMQPESRSPIIQQSSSQIPSNTEPTPKPAPPPLMNGNELTTYPTSTTITATPAPPPLVNATRSMSVTSTAASPVPIVMARQIPVAVAVGILYQPTMWQAIPTATMPPDEYDRIINAAWWPSKTWSQLGQRLQIFFLKRSPKHANEKHIVSLVVSHFDIHFANTVKPDVELEHQLQASLVKRFIVSTPCQRLTHPPGYGGNYNSGTTGICEWWTKVILILTVILGVVGFFFVTNSSQYTGQQMELFNAVGIFLFIVGGFFSLPGIWVLLIHVFRILVAMIACCCCCDETVCNRTVWWGHCCGCFDWLLPFCCCFNWNNNNRVVPFVEHAGVELEKEHQKLTKKEELKRRRRQFAEWNSYNRNDSCFELQIYMFYCCLLSDVPCSICRAFCQIWAHWWTCCTGCYEQILGPTCDKSCEACGRVVGGGGEQCGRFLGGGGDQCLQCTACFGDCIVECGACLGSCDMGSLDCAC